MAPDVRVVNRVDSLDQGRWLTLRSEIAGLSRAQIKEKLALPFEPT
jgi:hypothetical protein